jgi:hypothetical protein
LFRPLGKQYVLPVTIPAQSGYLIEQVVQLAKQAVSVTAKEIDRDQAQEEKLRVANLEPEVLRQGLYLFGMED